MVETVNIFDSLATLTPGINWLLSDLMEIAMAKGTSNENGAGESYLDGIPLDDLCKTAIAALNVSKMRSYISKVKSNFDIEDKDEVIKQSVKKILSLNTVVYTDVSGKIKGLPDKECVRIIGSAKREPEGRISFFYALSLYKYIYEKNDNPEEDMLFWAEHIEIPYQVNLYRVRGREVGRKNVKFFWNLSQSGERKKNQLSVCPSQEWENKMRKFIEDEVVNSKRYGYFENMDLDRVARSIPYVVTKEENYEESVQGTIYDGEKCEGLL